MLKSSARRFIARVLERQVKQLIIGNHLKVVAVTGSVGKTSTKLAIATILQQKFRVLAHEGNYNSEIGLPLSIFELETPSNLVNPLAWFKIFSLARRKAANYPYDVLVLELGADQPGDIGKFMGYLQPDIGIITAIAPAHTEQFGSVEAILEEKFKLALGSRLVMLNADDNLLMSRSSEVKDRLITFGEGGDYGWDELDLNRGAGQLRLGKYGTLGVKLNVIAIHAAQTIVIAGAVADQLGLDSQQIVDGAGQVKPFRGRMNPLSGALGSLIIDDTYNSSPSAAMAALKTLKTYSGTKIAIMGSMNELGAYSEEGHKLVGRACSGVDWLITIGEAASNYLAHEAVKVGMKPDKVKTFDSPYAAGAFVKNLLGKDVTVLAKGSQNRVFAEEAIKLLLANSKDEDQLVRQSPKWQAVKLQQFSDANESTGIN